MLMTGQGRQQSNKPSMIADCDECSTQFVGLTWQWHQTIGDCALRDESAPGTLKGSPSRVWVGACSGEEQSAGHG